MSSASSREFTGAEVDRLARSAFVKGPHFNMEACEQMAHIFNNLMAPSDLSPTDVPLRHSSQWRDLHHRKRRRAAFRELEDATSLPSVEHFWCDLEEEGAMAELRRALDRARPFLLGRDEGWEPARRPWAVAVLIIATITADYMRDAGYDTIGTQRKSRLAHFLELVMPRFSEEPPQREAIAAFLAQRNGKGVSAAELIAGR